MTNACENLELAANGAPPQHGGIKPLPQHESNPNGEAQFAGAHTLLETVAAGNLTGHPLDPLSRAEIRRAATAARAAIPAIQDASPQARFSYITLREPEKGALRVWSESNGALATCPPLPGGRPKAADIEDARVKSAVGPPARTAEAVLVVPATGLAYQVLVVLSTVDVPGGVILTICVAT